MVSKTPLVPIAFLLVASVALAQDGPPEGFTAIFSGKSLTGWQGDNPHTTVKMTPAFRTKAIEGMQADFGMHWKVENGELVHDGQPPYASTKEAYGDIELLAEFQTAAKADGGIYLRNAPKVRLGDAEAGSGALSNNTVGTPGQTPLAVADKPYGEWNQVRILQLGSRTTVEVNGQKVVEHAVMENFWYKNRQIPLLPTGPIVLQSDGGGMRFRNIYVRPVPAEEATKVLRGDDAIQGFTPLFNGKDFTGWAGAVGDYRIVDGAISLKPGLMGNLHTELALTDFSVRMEFQLPPGGNSGLTLRYSGEGNPSVNSLCEIQVIDDTSMKYTNIEPAQVNGSAYKLVAAYRGYLRPVGQWNYQEVTVQGNRVKLELNGTVVLDTDLPQRKTFASGYFGIVGQLDPVLFRNIAIKNIPSGKP